MQHMIMGAGNIGRHLAEILQARNECVKLYPLGHMQGADGPNLEHLEQQGDKDTVIWYAKGHGSIVQTDNEPIAAIEIGLTFPAMLCYALKRSSGPVAKLVFFSSDYVSVSRAFAGEATLYGKIKETLEQLAITTNNTGNQVYCVRVCSLFSSEIDKSFPDSVISNFWDCLEHNQSFTFTLNKTRPTPAKWLALVLADPEFLELPPGIMAIAPVFEKSILEWGLEVLKFYFDVHPMPLKDPSILLKIIDNLITVKYKFKDRKRPMKAMDPSPRHKINEIIGKYMSQFEEIYTGELRMIAAREAPRYMKRFDQNKIKQMIKEHNQLGQFF